MKMKKYLLFFAVAFSIYANADVRLPKLFAEDMVLQRNKLIPVWGWADANEKIEIHFNKQTKTTKADKTGKWIIRLDAENAGGPYKLSIQGKNKIVLKNVLVDEVWICSGQSNMEFPVNKAINAEKEMNNAGKDKVFYYAKAFISNNKVVISSENVANPVTLRFGWIGDASDNNLFNKEGFPAGPFRTDNWKTITETVKYQFLNQKTPFLKEYEIFPFTFFVFIPKINLFAKIYQELKGNTF